MAQSLRERVSYQGKNIIAYRDINNSKRLYIFNIQVEKGNDFVRDNENNLFKRVLGDVEKPIQFLNTFVFDMI